MNPLNETWKAPHPLGAIREGASGNLARKPLNALNHSTRIAARLLDVQADALMRREIDLALVVDRILLRHSVDRVIAPHRDEPVSFAVPPPVRPCSTFRRTPPEFT